MLGLYWILNGRHCSGVIVQCTSIFHDKDSNTFKALLLVLIKTFAKDDQTISYWKEYLESQTFNFYSKKYHVKGSFAFKNYKICDLYS